MPDDVRSHPVKNSCSRDELPRFVTAAGLEFYTVQQGNDPRCVFIHGFGGDLHLWDQLLSGVDPSLSSLRYDLRGFGKTRSSDDIAFRHNNDLLALLDALDIFQCDLVGVSMGGSIALNFALDHPERVRKLVLISPSIMAWEWSDAWQQLWEPIVQYAQEGNMPAARQQFYDHPLFASARESQCAQELYDVIMRYSGQEWLRDYQQLSLPDVDRLFELSAPTLLLTGGRDLNDLKVIANLLEACVENIQREDFPDQGHLIQLENPVECAKSIQRFFAET